MKILVIEDNATHIEAAQILLADHEVTIASTADQAYKEFEKSEFPYEAVLTDMFLPASNKQLADISMAGQETAYGMYFLMTAVEKGAKYVGMLTQTDHHKHPLSAALDRPFPIDKVMTFEKSKVVVCRQLSIGFKVVGSCTYCEGGKYAWDKSRTCDVCGGDAKEKLKGKDWKTVLEKLMK